MNIQKTQTRGFTLVELIVVITILVILGTIAFINLGGQSSSARDAKRTSDVRNLVSQINIKQTGGIDLADMVSSGSTYQITEGSLSIAGTGVAAASYTSKDYIAGTPNYTILGLSPDNFKDPTSKTQDYVMASTKLGTTGFQLAATMENDATGNPNKTALVMGTYNARKLTDTASGTISGASAPYTITLTTGKGVFKTGDYIFGTATGKITAVSSDLSTLSVDANVGSSGALRLATAETLGLIKNTVGTNLASSGVVNGSGATLPY